jgi:LmbE family N-acetylglucosaminyl deacetylase
MPLALFLSPHLDDVVFSCGGLAASLASAGWDTVLATAFTRSVVPATGFALACQLDKGLSPELDYMALRRAEDEVAAGLLGFGTNRWLNLLEAPHRGYEAAAELFGAIHQSDSVFLELAAHFIALSAEFQPDLVLAPQGLGNHVDHQQVVLAAGRSFPADRVAYYRDTPYAVLAGVGSTVPIGDVLDRKIAAAQAYASQIGFQFGGPAPLARALSDFALREGNGQAAERFCGSSVAGALQSLAA